MNTKHTQGKWEVSGKPFLHIENNEQWICQLSDIKEKPTEFLSDEYLAEEKRAKEETIANAHLLAAAPELLNALIMAYSFMITDPQHQGKQILETIKAALKKAEGKQ